MEQKPLTHVRAGLLVAGIAIVLNLLLTVALRGQAVPLLGFLQLAAVAGALAFFVRRYAQQQGGRLPFGDLFAFGFKATAVVTLIFVAFAIITALAMPQLREQLPELAQKQMGNNQLTDAQREQISGMTQKYFWTFLIAGNTMTYVITGAIGSLIGAAIAPRKN